MSTEENSEARLLMHREKLKQFFTRAPRMRSTLCTQQAEKILPYIEVALTGKDVQILFDDFIGRAPTTIYRLILDAFNWYIKFDQDIPEDKRKQIALLRATCYFPFDKDGYWIKHKKKGEAVDGRAGRTTLFTPTERKEIQDKRVLGGIWKEAFTKWIEDGEVGTVFDQPDVLLGPDDLAYVRAMAEALGMENQTTINHVWCKKV